MCEENKSPPVPMALANPVHYVLTILGICMLGACSGGGGSMDAPSIPLPASTYSGIVADKNGVPVSGATITAYLTNEHTEQVATTDANGAYTFTSLSTAYPYGSYEIRAKKTGYGFYPSVGNVAGAVIKTDYNGLYRTVIALPSHSNISLTVADANFTAFRTGDKMASLPRTGQTTSYVSGDDYSALKGVA